MPGSPDLASKLKQWRSALDLTQDGAAAKLGVPLGTYRDWEQGARTPDPLKAEAVLARMQASAPAPPKKKRRARG